MRSSMLVCLLLGPALLHAASGGGGGPPPSPVRVVTVATETVQPTTRLIGSLIAAQQVAVPSLEVGRLDAITVDTGDLVEAGQVIAQLDDRRLQATIEEAQAAITVAEAAITAARSRQNQAQLDAEALEQAAERQAIASIDARRARNEADTIAAELREREADLVAAQARLAAAQVRLDDTRITAPFAGRVIARHVDPGAWLAAGTPLVTIDSQALEVRIDVPERHWPAVQEHTRQCSVSVTSSPERLTTDRLRIVPAVDPRSRTFQVIGIMPSDQALASGLSATVDLPIGPAAEHLVVPQAAVLRGDGPPRVFTIQQEGDGPATATITQVDLVWATGTRQAIAAGGDLAAGDQVIVEGNERLRPGQPVRPIPVDGPSDTDADPEAP